MEGLGEIIRKERKALGLTLDQLAKLVGTSKAQLQRIEKGKKSPSVALLAEISNILKKPIEALIPAKRKGYYKLDRARQKLT
ncbi:MAG TPA: helix-turn-helix transcriptional regulator, partial [Thermodesulfobacteriota bacterium]|nr:helix-turn-helix transcriptional regulator [Thermodesulfobacteriota bacterium]